MHHGGSDSAALGAGITSGIPRFDPLAPRGSQAGRRLLVASILFHLVILALFWNVLIGVVEEKDETVVVRMLEEKIPEPEPKKQRRKVLAQRRVDASVRRFTEVVQPEIQQVKPVPVLTQTQKVDVTPMKVTDAPKKVEKREIVTENVNVFSDVPKQVQPVTMEQANPNVKQVKVAQATSGPRKVRASGPQTNTRAVDVESPSAQEGVISSQSVAGHTEGSRIAALESGISDRDLDGTGRDGIISGTNKDCMKDPVCREYLQMIRDRVYARWHIPQDIDPGKIILAFRIDRGGSAHGVTVKAADDQILGDTCQTAFRHASPFPPPPKEIHYIVNKKLSAKFSYD